MTGPFVAMIWHLLTPSASPPGAAGTLLQVRAGCYGGLVAVDRRDVGHVPLGPVAVSPGFHLVEIGCRGAPRAVRLVYVAPGATETVTFPAAVVPRPAVPPEPPSPAPRGRTDEPAFALVGQAALAAETTRPPTPDRLAVEQVWFGRYGPPGEAAWWVASRLDARHPVDGTGGTSARERWAVRSLEGATGRSGGWRGRAGRRVRVMAWRTPGHLDGAGVEVRRGPFAADAAAGLDDAGALVARLGVSAGGHDAPSAGPVLDVVGEAGRRRRAASVVATGPRWSGWTLDGAATAAEAGAEGGRLRLTVEGALGTVAAAGQWRRRPGAARTSTLPPLAALSEASDGPGGELRLDARAHRLRLAIIGVSGGFGGGASATSTAKFGSLVAGASVDGLWGAGPLPDRRRLLAVGRIGRVEGWHLGLGVGPELVRWPDGVGSAGLALSTTVAAPIGGTAWLSLRISHGAADRRGSDGPPTATGGVLALELR